MRGKLNTVSVMRVLAILALQCMLSCEASFLLPHVGSVGQHLKPFGFRPGPLGHYRGKVEPILGPIGPSHGILSPLLDPFGPKPVPRFGRGDPKSAYNPGGLVSASNPGGPISTNNLDGPRSTNNLGDPRSTNNPGDPISAYNPGSLMSTYNPSGPMSTYNPSGPMSTNNLGGPMSTNNLGGPMSANNLGGPMSAYNPGSPMSANNPSGPISAYNPDGPMSAYNPSGPMSINNPNGLMSTYNPGSPVSANSPSGPMTAYNPSGTTPAYNPSDPTSSYNPGSLMSAYNPSGPVSAYNSVGPMSAYNHVGPMSGVGPSRPKGPFGPWRTFRLQSLFGSGGISEGGGIPYRGSGRRRGRNDVRGDGPAIVADRSDMGSVFGFGPQDRSDPGLAQRFDLGSFGAFDGANSFIGRQNVNFLGRDGIGSGIGRFRSYLGPRDNDRYRYTRDLSRDAEFRDPGYRDNWSFRSDLDYNGDSSVLSGRIGGRPGIYQRNDRSMIGFDGNNDIYDYSGNGRRRRGRRRGRYGRRGMRTARSRHGYRRYNRNDRGYDTYDYDITRSFVSDNDKRIGDAGGNWDGHYSIGGSRTGSGRRRGRGRGISYENGVGKLRPRSKNDFKYPDNDNTKIINEIYENNGSSGTTSTNKSSINLGYNADGDRLLFTDGRDGLRKISVNQGGLADGFVDRSVGNIDGPYGDKIGGNIGDAFGPKMADVGVSDIARGRGSEISVGGVVSDVATGTTGVEAGGRDGNAGGLDAGGDINGNGGQGFVDSGSAVSDRGIGGGGADGSIKVYRSRVRSSGGSGTGAEGNGNGGVYTSSGKSKHDFKNDDDDGTKLMRETYIHRNYGGSDGPSSNASTSGSGSADGVGLISDKASISAGRRSEVGGAESVPLDNIQATVSDILYLDRSDTGIRSLSGNQHVKRVDNRVSDNVANSGSGSVDSIGNLGASVGSGGIGGNGERFVIAGDAVGPGSTDKRGSDVKEGGVASVGNVGNRVNHANKVGVVDGGYTGEDEASIRFVVRDLTGWL